MSSCRRWWSRCQCREGALRMHGAQRDRVRVLWISSPLVDHFMASARESFPTHGPVNGPAVVLRPVETCACPADAGPADCRLCSSYTSFARETWRKFHVKFWTLVAVFLSLCVQAAAATPATHSEIFSASLQS